MKNVLKRVSYVMALVLSACTSRDAIHTSPAAVNSEEARFITNVRQLVLEGKRSGEGYFNRDGTEIVFQSESEPGNPFYQIYWMDLDEKIVQRVSPGYGKTTCAWIHPSDDKIIFASTHANPQSLAKQEKELQERAAGRSRTYRWDYDPDFDIYETTRSGNPLKNLTRVKGYDAEGSYSPDGKLIAFASNRSAFDPKRSAAEMALLERDPSYFMDIYIMHADGSNVRRLTNAPGYDGGPFFSPDGTRIVWRRFSIDGETAEVYTMNINGSDQRQITKLGALSWAPYYHPSGDYIIFATTIHGFKNFELYLVDSNGKEAPVRVTTFDGFDGLPVFSPDGNQLLWSAARGADRAAQLFVADWNDTQARAALGLGSKVQ